MKMLGTILKLLKAHTYEKTIVDKCIQGGSPHHMEAKNRRL